MPMRAAFTIALVTLLAAFTSVAFADEPITTYEIKLDRPYKVGDTFRRQGTVTNVQTISRPDSVQSESMGEFQIGFDVVGKVEMVDDRGHIGAITYDIVTLQRLTKAERAWGANRQRSSACRREAAPASGHFRQSGLAGGRHNVAC